VCFLALDGTRDEPGRSSEVDIRLPDASSRSRPRADIPDLAVYVSIAAIVAVPTWVSTTLTSHWKTPN